VVVPSDANVSCSKATKSFAVLTVWTLGIWIREVSVEKGTTGLSMGKELKILLFFK
jgi:hypothetical protein